MKMIMLNVIRYTESADCALNNCGYIRYRIKEEEKTYYRSLTYLELSSSFYIKDDSLLYFFKWYGNNHLMMIDFSNEHKQYKELKEC